MCNFSVGLWNLGVALSPYVRCGERRRHVCLLKSTMQHGSLSHAHIRVHAHTHSFPLDSARRHLHLQPVGLCDLEWPRMVGAVQRPDSAHEAEENNEAVLP